MINQVRGKIQLNRNFCCSPWVSSHSDLSLMWWEWVAIWTIPFLCNLCLPYLKAIWKYSLGCSFPKCLEKWFDHTLSLTLPLILRQWYRLCYGRQTPAAKIYFSRAFPLLNPRFPGIYVLEVHWEKSWDIPFHIIKDGTFPVCRNKKLRKLSCCCSSNEYIDVSFIALSGKNKFKLRLENTVPLHSTSLFIYGRCVYRIMKKV